MSKDLDDFISIHAPVKGATIGLICECGSIHNFNPRSREGSDFCQCDPASRLLISIHAPVKGATGRLGYDRPLQSISIHAPVKGATPVTEDATK